MDTNTAMNFLLNKYQILSKLCGIKLEPNLTFIIQGGIVNMKCCYFLRELLPSGFDFDKEEAIQQAFDLTGFECLINHTHIGDYLPHSKGDKEEIIYQGILYALSLKECLPDSVGFKIILSCSFEPRIDCSIRFHKQRPGEEWLTENLEKYEEPIMVLNKN